MFVKITILMSNLASNSINIRLTSGMDTVGIDRTIRSLRKLDCSKDICAFGVPVCAEIAVKLRVRVLNCVEVDAGAVCMRRARDEDYSRGEAGRRRRQKFGCEKFREEEWSDVVGTHLALQSVNGEFKGSDGRGCVVDKDLERRGKSPFDTESTLSYMYRLRVGVDLCSGFADASEGRKVESQTADVGCRNILLDAVLGELQSNFNFSIRYNKLPTEVNTDLSS
jgi:hypothetical protein